MNNVLMKKNYHICKKCPNINTLMITIVVNVKIIVFFTGKYRVAGQSVCNLRYSKTKEISVVSHKGSNYDYYFIIKKTSKIV